MQDDDVDIFGNDLPTPTADDAAEADGKRRRPRPHPRLALASNALRAALTRGQLRTLRSRRAGCVVIGVPSAAWKAPVADVVRTFGRWHQVFTPTVKRRGANPDIDPSAVAEAIALGARVLVVCDDPAAVPRFMATTADLTLTIPHPGDEVIRRTIAAVTRGRVPSVPAGIATGLGYEELVGAMRVSSRPAEIIGRLVTAAARAVVSDTTLDEAPDLETLAGYGEAMTWCRGLVADLEDWRAGQAAFPRGARAVFAGPPGTGKTTLVRALAKAARLPLIATGMGAWFAQTEGHLGDVVRAIQGVWDAARLAAPCVLFLDEIDAIPDRSRLSDRAREWWTPVVTHLLTLLDGATSPSPDIVVIGATNFAAALDPALVRPGRMERVILIDLPRTEEDCEAILRHHLGRDLVGEDLSPLAPLLVGMTGAEMMAVARDARRNARPHGRPVSVQDLAGILKPPDARPAVAVRRAAIHEAGHAVGARALGHVLRFVSIVESGDVGGRVSGSSNATDLPTRATVEDMVVMMLCGTAAEERLLGARSTGAGGALGSDLATATETIAALRVSYGLSGDLTFRAQAPDAARLLRDDPELRQAVEADLRRLYERAAAMVSEHAGAILALAEQLVKVRFMTGTQVEAFLARRPVHGDEGKEPGPEKGGAGLPSPEGAGRDDDQFASSNERHRSAVFAGSASGPRRPSWS